MSQTHINIRENDIKRIAKEVKRSFGSVTVSSMIAEPSHMQLLNAICRGLWGKTYEEAKATLIDQPQQQTRDAAADNAAPAVHLITYANETILTLNGEYVTGDFPGTDLTVPYDTLVAQAESLANAHDSTGKEVVLPRILNEEHSASDIVDLARRLGYFRHREPLIEALQSIHAIEHEGKVCALEWSQADIEQEFFESKQTYLFESGVSWEPEFWDEAFERAFTALNPAFQTEHSGYEFHWSLDDIGRAEQLSDGGWFISNINSTGDDESGEIIHLLALKR